MIPIFVFNFNPENSYDGYMLKVFEEGKYKVALSTDESRFGGWNRVSKKRVYKPEKGRDAFPIYLPARVGVCLKKI